MKEFTTIENLTDELRPGYDALVTYKKHVCTARQNWKGGYEASIYEFIDEPEDGFAEIECRLSKIDGAENFQTSGDAIKWCFDELDS